MTRIEESEQ